MEGQIPKGDKKTSKHPCENVAESAFGIGARTCVQSAAAASKRPRRSHAIARLQNTGARSAAAAADEDAGAEAEAEAAADGASSSSMHREYAAAASANRPPRKCALPASRSVSAGVAAVGAGAGAGAIVLGADGADAAAEGVLAADADLLAAAEEAPAGTGRLAGDDGTEAPPCSAGEGFGSICAGSVTTAAGAEPPRGGGRDAADCGAADCWCGRQRRKIEEQNTNRHSKFRPFWITRFQCWVLGAQIDKDSGGRPLIYCSSIARANHTASFFALSAASRFFMSASQSDNSVAAERIAFACSRMRYCTELKSI